MITRPFGLFRPACMMQILALAVATAGSALAQNKEPQALPLPMGSGAATAAGSKGSEAAKATIPEIGCRDFRRRPVRVLEVPALGDVGRAEFVGSGPVIKVDPDIMRRLPNGLQAFFALHECGHHALGHLFAPTSESEKEADCWAMKEGVRRQDFAAADVAGWRPFFENSRGSAFHLPGPQRVTFLANCLSD